MKTHIDLKLEIFRDQFLNLKFNNEEDRLEFFERMIRGWLQECCLNYDDEPWGLKPEEIPFNSEMDNS